MNYLTNLMTEFLLISSVATPMVLVVFLLKPINSRFQTLKWQNLILKLTLVLFFLPVYSLFGELSLPVKTVETQKPVVTVPFVPNVIETPELFSDVTETEETGVNFIDYLPILSVFWIIGVILSIFFQSYCYRKFKNSIKSARQTEDETLLAMLSSERQKLGIRQNIPLYTSHHVASPMVSGIFSSKIYIPEENTIEKHVLTHELIHYKNKDLWWKALLLVGKVLHWYNPFIYLLGQELEENLEFCCDLEVIEQLDVEEKKQYALTILSTYEKGTLYGLGLNHRPKQLERRVKMMFEKKKKSVVVASFTGFTLLFVLGLASTMANQSSFKEETEQNISDGTIHIGATASGATEEVAKINDLENRISDKIHDEFAVDSVVYIVDYDTTPLVSINLQIDSVEDTLEEEKIEDLVLELMSDWETVNFHILYVIMDGEMSIVGVEQWDESQKNPLSEVEVFIGAMDIGEYELGSIEDDEGFKDFEEYHPETGELMTPTEWVLYQEEQARLNFDIYEYIESVDYVLAEEKNAFTEEDWQIILETAKTRENFFFETVSDYINYLEEQGFVMAGYDLTPEVIEANPSHYSRRTDETYEIEEGNFIHEGKTYPYQVTATRMMEESDWELVVYTTDPEISFAEIMMAGVGLSSAISDYKYFQSRAVLISSN